MKRMVSFVNSSLDIGNEKTRELMEVVLGEYDAALLKNKDIIEACKDIDRSYAVIAYIERKKAFALLLTGKKNMYLAVFNFEKEPVKFYCDLSVHLGYKELDGVAEEVYSNTNYLIVDGKLYIRNLSSMD